jgi:hypothetical protein
MVVRWHCAVIGTLEATRTQTVGYGSRLQPCAPVRHINLVAFAAESVHVLAVIASVRAMFGIPPWAAAAIMVQKLHPDVYRRVHV